jgi:hypothetical protein
MRFATHQNSCQRGDKVREYNTTSPNWSSVNPTMHGRVEPSIPGPKSLSVGTIIECPILHRAIRNTLVESEKTKRGNIV